jgi:hypothetical protein
MSGGTPLVSVSEQTRRLGELRRRVGRLPQDVVVNRDEDAAFRRFLVARKWDVDKAEEQLRNSLRWRAQEFRILAFLVRAAAPRKHARSRVRAGRSPTRRCSAWRSCADCCPPTRS